MSDSLLNISDLHVSFGDKHSHYDVVSGVDLEIKKGKTVALVGESGCGKTMTALSILRLIPSLAKLRARHIQFMDKDLLHMREGEIRSLRGNRIGMVFQEPMSSLNPVFTIGLQIEEVLKAHRYTKKRRERVIEVLKQVQFPYWERAYKIYPHELSGGLRQRVMIAMALACNPTLLIADEPTTALDVTIQAEILNLLAQIRQEMDMSILLITHDLGIVSEIADTVYVMYAGQIVEDVSAHKIFEAPEHPYTQRLLKALPQNVKQGERLETIKGNVVDPKTRPRGCWFHPRCLEIKERCRFKDSELKEIKASHHVRCWER